MRLQWCCCLCLKLNNSLTKMRAYATGSWTRAVTPGRKTGKGQSSKNTCWLQWKGDTWFPQELYLSQLHSCTQSAAHWHTHTHICELIKCLLTHCRFLTLVVMLGTSKDSVLWGIAGGHSVFGLLFASSHVNDLCSGTLSFWQPGDAFVACPAPLSLVSALPAVTAFCSSKTPTLKKMTLAIAQPALSLNFTPSYHWNNGIIDSLIHFYLLMT